MWNPCTCECNEPCKVDEYLYVKNCSCEERLIGKLGLECHDKISNTTENSLKNKKRNMWKKVIPFFALFH